jgi:hypothetical protein
MNSERAARIVRTLRAWMSDSARTEQEKAVAEAKLKTLPGFVTFNATVPEAEDVAFVVASLLNGSAFYDDSGPTDCVGLFGHGAGPIYAAVMLDLFSALQLPPQLESVRSEIEEPLWQGVVDALLRRFSLVPDETAGEKPSPVTTCSSPRHIGLVSSQETPCRFKPCF